MKLNSGEVDNPVIQGFVILSAQGCPKSLKAIKHKSPQPAQLLCIYLKKLNNQMPNSTNQMVRLMLICVYYKPNLDEANLSYYTSSDGVAANLRYYKPNLGLWV